MPNLKYAVRDQKHRKVYGSAEAATKEELVRSLHSKGLTVVALCESVDASGRKRVTQKMHKGVRMDDITLFSTQMAVLIESGIPIIKSLDIVSQQIQSSSLLRACKKIEEDIKSGGSLRDAVAKHPKIFSSMWVDLIETGEATGQLALVLRQLAEYLEEAAELKKKIISALFYPAVLIVVSVLAIMVFMYKVIPIFAGIYKGFTAEMPMITQMVIYLSEAIQKNFIKGIIILAISAALIRAYLKTEKGKIALDRLKLKIPVLGEFFRSLAIERFTSSLEMLVRGGISIVHALEVSGRASSNKIVEEAVVKVKLSVIQGKPMSVPLAETGIFPPLVSQMIGVGEETGKLTDVLKEISKYYANDVSTRVTRFVSLFEPLLLVIMGGIIGVLVVAMYLPIFQIANVAGGG